MTKSKKVLQVKDIQLLIEKGLATSNWIDLVCVVDDIEASFTVSAVKDRLCGMFESVGIADYMLWCHRIKQVYYSLVILDEFNMNCIPDHAHFIMKDMLESLDKLIRQNEADYKG